MGMITFKNYWDDKKTVKKEEKPVETATVDEEASGTESGETENEGKETTEEPEQHETENEEVTGDSEKEDVTSDGNDAQSTENSDDLFPEPQKPKRTYRRNK